MTDRRRAIPYAVLAGCATAALVACLWGAPGAGSRREEAGTGADAGADAEGRAERRAQGILELPARSSSSTRFLDDLARSEGGDEGAAAVTWERDADVPALAAEVLEAYRTAGVELATSGYLDLKGNAWGAVLRGGEGWADVVTVAGEGPAAAGGERSRARVVRLWPQEGAVEAPEGSGS